MLVAAALRNLSAPAGTALVGPVRYCQQPPRPPAGMANYHVSKHAASQLQAEPVTIMRTRSALAAWLLLLLAATG